MSIRELQQSYESRIKGMRGFIYKQTKTDEDLRQEACMAMWRGLIKDPGATDGFIMNRIQWRIRDVWKQGRSIDTHPESRRKAKVCLLNDGDAEDEVIAECMRDKYLPLDEQVIAKIDTERFLQSLDYNEMQIVKYKLKGLVDRDIYPELGITRKHYRRVKRGIRPKTKKFFAV